jgi:hypothetical protein
MCDRAGVDCATATGLGSQTARRRRAPCSAPIHSFRNCCVFFFPLCCCSFRLAAPHPFPYRPASLYSLRSRGHCQHLLRATCRTTASWHVLGRPFLVRVVFSVRVGGATGPPTPSGTFRTRRQCAPRYPRGTFTALRGWKHRVCVRELDEALHAHIPHALGAAAGTTIPQLPISVVI